MKKTYINPQTAPVACHTWDLMATRPGEGIDFGGDHADGDFEELSREERDDQPLWEDWQ